MTIQGVEGCFHDAAAREYFAMAAPQATVRPLACDTFADMFDVMAARRDCFGVMAIENTIAGALLPNHELLRRSDLRIVGEYKKRISHTIAAPKGATLEGVKAVMSHPMALMQCEVFLREHAHIRPVEWFDTAGAARDVAAGGDPSRAAICPAYAAKLYGLDILSEGIETNKHNFTRFLILAHEESDLPFAATKRPDKAAVVFALPHTQGALSKILTILSFYDLNLTKIQSMPLIGREWEYRFYVDLTFADIDRYHQAIAAVRPLLNDFRELGVY